MDTHPNARALVPARPRFLMHSHQADDPSIKLGDETVLLRRPRREAFPLFLE